MMIFSSLKMRFCMGAVLLAGVVFTSCSSSDDGDSQSYTSVAEVNKFYNLITNMTNQNWNFGIVDYRDSASFAAGHIPGAVNVYITQANSATAAAGFADSVKAHIPVGYYVLVYGDGTMRNLYAGSCLSEAGYGSSKTVVFLGDFDAWKNAGYTVEK